ncbi:hypothetical protein H0E87_021232 [Populus deltoides]|uniref:Uncharacterized protein n=1 Tax=Populus deltoides TaxID=3696 RepID=A0A8T2XRZ8_POPDE|nr:hypothetical protein H0E87_021232 [Populus deltoides]
MPKAVKTEVTKTTISTTGSGRDLKNLAQGSNNKIARGLEEGNKEVGGTENRGRRGKQNPEKTTENRGGNGGREATTEQTPRPKFKREAKHDPFSPSQGLRNPGETEGGRGKRESRTFHSPCFFSKKQSHEEGRAERNTKTGEGNMTGNGEEHRLT